VTSARDGRLLRDRRRFLRGVGRAAAALPFYRLLESSAVHAQAGAAPLRFLGVYTPHGIAAPLFGRRPGETETTYDLRFPDSVLSPFDDATTQGFSFKDKITTIEGIDLAAGIEKSTNGHDASCVILTGSAPQGQKTANESVDQFLAVTHGLGAKTRFASLVLAVGNKSTESGWNLSYSASGTPLPKLVNPVEVFDMLFADLVVGDDPAARAEAEKKRRRGASVLDFLRKDIGRLNARLAGPEKLKLEQHLGSLREIEKQLEGLGGGGQCAKPARPAAPAKLLQYNGGEPHFDTITDLQIDLLAQAFACDLTRFATLFLNDLSRTKLDPTLPEDIHNQVAHTYDPPTGSNYGSPGKPGNPETWRQLAKQNRYSFGKCARLLRRLEEAKVLDSSLVYMTSDMGDPARHSLRNVPTILAGGAGGRIKTGRRIVLHDDCPPDRWFCNDPKLVSNNKILVKICQVFGVQVDKYGTAGKPEITSGALTELG
jgi:hypothetical protein